MSLPRRSLRNSLLAASAALLLLALHPAAGQQTTGTLHGIALDSTGRPIPLANISVTGSHLQGIRGSVSGDNGAFNILALPPGVVRVTISHLSYQTVILEHVRIQLGRRTDIGKIRLHTRTSELPEVLAVGRRQLLDPGSTTYGVYLRSADFEDLPVERNYRSIITLTPQANISYLDDDVTIGGATGLENKYFVDGVDVTDPSFARTGTNLPYNFIKDIEVIAGGYEAEYRSVLGGIVNVTTFSGGNEFHGSAFGFFTSSHLTGSRRGKFLDPTQGPFTNFDVGFGIGGPILQDELWFYAAYNPTFARRDVDLPGFGTYTDNTTMHAFAGKLTWNAFRRLSLVLTVSGDPTVRRAVGDTPPGSGLPVRLQNPDPYLTDQTDGGVNFSLNGSYSVSDAVLFDGSFSRISRDETLEHVTEMGRRDTVLINTETGVWSGGGFGHLSFFRSGTSARAAATILAGPHTLKTGLEFRENRQEVDLDYPIVLFRHSDTSYTFMENGTHGAVRNRISSAFLQDTWSVFRNLRVHAGIRWDGQSILGGNGAVVHTIDGPLQPRVGFIFLPDEDGTQKVSGSFGRFTQEWSSAVMTIYTGSSYFGYKPYHSDPRISGFLPVTFDPIPESTALQGQHFDEWNLGYERVIGGQVKLALQGNYRILREAINVGEVEGYFLMGNPGRGVLSIFPRPRREYTSISLTVEQRGDETLNFLASYVLSRSYGNYEGIHDSHNRNIVPNVNFSYSNVAGLANATGLLPNDRTHVLKFTGSYRLGFGLVAGISFAWQTGTPLSELAGMGWFVTPRGSGGRTPSIWDLSARLAYPLALTSGLKARLLLDVFHIASRREAVDFDQQHYFKVTNGIPADVNPSYGVATVYQPPVSARLGVEVSF